MIRTSYLVYMLAEINDNCKKIKNREIGGVNMKLKKKLLSALATVVLLTSLGITTTFANESNDTSWSIPAIDWNSNQVYRTTNARPKTDTTSGYGNILNGNDSNSLMTMQLKNSDGGDLIGTYRVLPPVQFIGNVSHYVPSNAYENGYRQVCMGLFQRTTYRLPWAHGLWSPDSY